MQERADEAGVPGRLAGKVVLEPGRDPLEIFIPAGQYSCLHHDLPDVVQAGGGRQFVQQVVAERPVFGDEMGEQPGGRAAADPLDRGEGPADLGECPGQRLQLG